MNMCTHTASYVEMYTGCMCIVGTLKESVHHAAHIGEDVEEKGIKHTEYQYLVNLHHQHQDISHRESGQKYIDSNMTNSLTRARMQVPTYCAGVYKA